MHTHIVIGKQVFYYACNDTNLFIRVMHLENLGLPQRLLTETKHFLQTTYPHVHTFSTLSPIPGFLSWLRHPDHTAQVEKAMPVSVQRSLQKALEDITSQQLLPASVTLSACARRTPLEVLVRLLHHVVAVEEETREEDWSRKEALLERFKEPVRDKHALRYPCAYNTLQWWFFELMYARFLRNLL